MKSEKSDMSSLVLLRPPEESKNWNLPTIPELPNVVMGGPYIIGFWGLSPHLGKLQFCGNSILGAPFFGSFNRSGFPKP